MAVKSSSLGRVSGFVVSRLKINYLIPARTPNGDVTVRRNGTDIAQGAANIVTVAAGLFSANASAQGVPATLILRHRNGVDTFEPVAQFNSTAIRIDQIEINHGPTFTAAGKTANTVQIIVK